MDKMIKEIYNGVVRGSGYMAGADKRIQEEIEKLFQEEKNKTGFKYAVMLLKECLLD